MYTETIYQNETILGKGNIDLPVTLSLTSTNASRDIQLSSDGGVTYYTYLAAAVSEPDVLISTVNHPFTHIKVIAEAGDSFSIDNMNSY